MRGEQPTVNSGPVQRIFPGQSIPSVVATATTLRCSPPVSKSGVGVVTKNSISQKDSISHLSQKKLSLASASVKGSSAAKPVSILVSGPSTTHLQAQLKQNHYNIK